MTDLDSTIRQLQIDLITNDANPIIQWFDEIWLDVSVKDIHNDTEVIYYNTNKEWLLYYNKINNEYNFNIAIIWINFPYRSVFSQPYNFISIINLMLFEYKLNIFTNPEFNPVNLNSLTIQEY